MIVDSHCHLIKIKNYVLKNDLLPVTVGYSHYTNEKTAELAEKLHIPYVLGIAPQTAVKESVSEINAWADFILKNAPNAIGEIGLDFHWAREENDIQKEKIVFGKMLELAEKMRLPVVIHSRDRRSGHNCTGNGISSTSRKATTEVLDTLSVRDFKLPFMLHFFSGTLNDAKRAVDMGGLISIPHLHSKERHDVIAALALENLLVESDAPYVGKTPDDTKKAIDYISEVKKIHEKRVEEQTAENAFRFFRLKREVYVGSS